MKRKIFLFSAIFIFIYEASLSIANGQSSMGNLPNGVTARFSPGASVFTVAFSPDGQLLASGGDDNAVILWGVADRSERETFIEHGSTVMSVAFSPDGQRLASACLDGFVRLWDVANQRRRISLTHEGWVRTVAFSPDGKTLVSGGGDQLGMVVFWDVRAEKEIATFTGHESIVESVVFSPDGKYLVSASRDNAVILWDVPRQRMHRKLTKHKNVVYAAAFSPDGQVLATSSRDKTIKLWHVNSGENFATLNLRTDQYVYAEGLVFSPDGKYLASACVDHTIRIWDTNDHHAVATLRGHDGGVTSVAFSPDGKTLASGSRDRTVLLWDLPHFNIVPTPVPVDTTPPNIVILSPTERVVPSTVEDLTVQGEARDDNTISEVNVNGQEVWLSAEGRFTTTVELDGGENEIRMTATDTYGNMETERFTIVRSVPQPPLPAPKPVPSADLDPPILSLEVPTEIEATEFVIQGSVTDDSGVAEVKVNNRAISVSEEGDFTTSVLLVEGRNEIRVTATDTYGNMETNRFIPFRKDPPIDVRGPEIRILTPAPNRARGLQREIHIDTDFVTVSGTASDPSGVSEVSVQGAEAQRTGENFTAEVQLTRGDNLIHITASDTLGNVSEKKITVYHSQYVREGKDYALLFAVEDYDDWPELHNPVSDAESIQRDLDGLYGFQTELIKNPTRAGIFETFRRYAEMDYTDADQLFIFFAGHGYFDETFRGGYLVARDTKKPEDDTEMLSYVSHSVIRDIIDRMRCKHILLVLDTCYSGTFDRLIAMRGRTEPLSERLTETDIQRKFQYTTRWYLTSGGNEIVYDDSPFVHQLLEALRSKGGVDNILTKDEILSYVQRLVSPKPCASGFGIDEPGSDFLFFAIE